MNLASPIEQQRLWKLYSVSRTLYNRNKLVEMYYPLSVCVVKHMVSKMRPLLEISDLSGTAALRLIKAVETFDNRQGSNPQIWIGWSIKNAIIDEVRRLSSNRGVIRKNNKGRESVDYKGPHHFTIGVDLLVSYANDVDPSVLVELSDLLQMWCNLLSKDVWQVILLRMSGMNVSAIGRELGFPYSSTRNRYLRALAILSERFGICRAADLSCKKRHRTLDYVRLDNSLECSV